MTRTEERLQDALRAQAARVEDNRLRPLPALETAPRRHTAWLVPAAAAMSVLLIVALAVTLAGRSHKGAPSAGYPALPAGFPKYFAQFGDPPQLDVVIRSTSTGAEVTSVSAPNIQGFRLTPLDIAAAPDGRTFYVSYRVVDLSKRSDPGQIWIYQYTWANHADASQSGSLEWIKGNPFPGNGLLVNGGSMAVSPDGSKLALTDNTKQLSGQSWPDAIIVVDLRTGARSTWQGGMSRP
ncbi:MAG TPA: hypothetical protein VKF59_02275, partial [Candidatus Dormibacteraeota bacterium]|nr:hypothetical protein [Candidatus Dormibacteraeota bacterium]